MKKRLVALLVVVMIIIGIWLIIDYNSSYAEAEEALEIEEGLYTALPVYEHNNKALFFLLNEHKAMGVTYVHKGWFGWKAGESSRVGLNDIRLGTFYGYSVLDDDLIYGLIEKLDGKMILVNQMPVKVLPLSTFNEVEELGLQDLTFWYVEPEGPIDDGSIDLIDNETGELIDQIEL